MICVNCGKEISDKAKFCPECGTKLEAEKQELREDNPRTEEDIVKESQEEINEKEKIVDAEIVEEEEASADELEPEKSTAEEIKEKLDEKIEEAKQTGKDFVESDTVQKAKKEMDDLLEEAKAASQRQAGQTVTEGEKVVPREEVSFLVDWLYWTGRRNRMKYLLICIITSVCSLALGATGVLSLLFCYISAVNLVKRLHDFDKPGWYAFLLMFAEYVIINLTWIFGLLGVGLAAAGSMMGLILWFVPLLIVWAIKLWVFTVPGTKGPNRFGPESY